MRYRIRATVNGNIIQDPTYIGILLVTQSYHVFRRLEYSVHNC